MILRKILRNSIEKSNFGYRLLLKKSYRIFRPTGYPNAPWSNAVLKTHKELHKAIKQVIDLDLPVMPDLPKNWDSLAALDLIFKNTNKKANIFDAGGELYSVILPWLFLYGYKNLTAGNLIFKKPIKKGPIIYKYNDITQTEFDNETFDAITCLSVIEHGVDLNLYFSEMSRILKKGGILITSTDYFETPIDTKDQFSLGVPIHIFNKDEIVKALNIADHFGLKLKEPIDLSSKEKVVNWEDYNLQFTFIIFSLYKT